MLGRFVALVAAVVMCVTYIGSPAMATTTSEPNDDTPAATTAQNPFLPEDTDVNLTDCVSALPRPECGSKERGGWRQLVVFGVVVGGLAVIGTRVVMQMNRRRGDRDDAAGP